MLTLSIPSGSSRSTQYTHTQPEIGSTQASNSHSAATLALRGILNSANPVQNVRAQTSRPTASSGETADRNRAPTLELLHYIENRFRAMMQNWSFTQQNQQNLAQSEASSSQISNPYFQRAEGITRMPSRQTERHTYTRGSSSRPLDPDISRRLGNLERYITQFRAQEAQAASLIQAEMQGSSNSDFVKTWEEWSKTCEERGVRERTQKILKDFLEKLFEQNINNFILNRIEDVLKELKIEKENNENILWEKCVEVAEEVDSSCTDGALIGLEEIELMIQVLEAVKLGKEGAKIVLKCVKEDLVMKIMAPCINKFVKKHTQNTKRFDPKELQLQLMLHLKEEEGDLNLSLKSKSMRFQIEAKLRAEDIDEIKGEMLLLMTIEKKFEYILINPAWKYYLNKTHAGEFKEVLDKKYNEYIELEEKDSDNRISKYSEKMAIVFKKTNTAIDELIKELTLHYAPEFSSLKKEAPVLTA